ncbi:hypothetical protein [Marinicella sp. W31]|uniref:hypothetical protein n=1 Tax=Marinicella sp. W31 TaxID=3023713 RepID=UPI003757635C
MKTQHDNQISALTESKKSIRTLAYLTAKISLKFGIVWREFVELYKKHLVIEAKKQYPKYSSVELSGRTGIDRRYIAQYLNEEEIKLKPSKIQIVLQQIKTICERNGTNLIAKAGPFQTFESICNTTAHGTLTPNAIAKELLRLGNIKDHGNHYELVSKIYISNSTTQGFTILSRDMGRLTETVVNNIDKEDSKDKKYQRSIYTTQINPKHFAEIETKAAEILSHTLESMNELLTTYEEPVPRDTYPSYGASMFTFGPDHNTKND